MTPTPSPFSGDNFDEIKSTADERNKLALRMAREQLMRGADEYIRLTGKENVDKQMNGLRASIEGMNRVTGGTVRLSIPSLEAMIIAVAMIPQRVGIHIAQDPRFGDLQLSLYAFKRILELEREEKLKNQSTIPPIIPIS